MQKIERDILIEIDNNPGVTNKGLMEALGVSRSTLNYNLEKLEDEKLISKEKLGRNIKYYISSQDRINKYFDKQISEITQIKERLVETVEDRSDKPKMVIANWTPISSTLMESLSDYFDIEVNDGFIIPQDEFVRRCKDAEVIVNNWACDFDATVIKQLPKLKYMHSACYADDYIDYEAAKAGGIEITRTPREYKKGAIEEFVLAQTLSLIRNIPSSIKKFQNGEENFTTYNLSGDLRGSKVGVVASGPVLADVVRVFRALDCDVIANNRLDENPADCGLSRFSSLSEIQEQAKIMIHLEYGCENDVKLSREYLESVNADYLVYIGSGPGVDFGYIAEMMESGELKGFAADVGFIDGDYYEDLKKISEYDNAIVTPDICWLTDNTIYKMNKYLYEYLMKWVERG